ncbi:MAG: hypothetical protein AAFY60_07170 [Myxococcota bacterium]
MTISFISLIITFKILVTLVLVGLPFLVMSKTRLERISGVTAVSPAFFRLYGIAIVALLIGYATAFPLIQEGQFPWGVAIMGAASNGGASLVLIQGAKQVFVPIYASIFVGLVVCMKWPELAMASLT